MWHRISTADLTYLYDTLKAVGVELPEDITEELESAIEITEEALHGPTSEAFNAVTGDGIGEEDQHYSLGGVGFTPQRSV
jgi:hypothetical protein